MADAPEDQGADEPGWAAPGLPPREPSGGDAPPPASDPGAPTTPPPPAPPSAPSTPSAAWQAPQGATPPVVPPAPGGVTAPPRRGRAWLVILGIVLGITLVAAVAGTLLFVDRSLPPYDAAHDWVEAMDSGHFNAAYDQLCAPDKSLDDAEGFRSAFGSLFDGTASANALTVDRDSDRATVEFTVDRPGTERDKTYELPLRLEDGDWRACPGDSLRS